MTVVGSAKAGIGTLFVDGEKVGEAKLTRTVPFVFSADDFTDIGNDHGAPVTEDYGYPARPLHRRVPGCVSTSGMKPSSDPAGMEEALAGRA